MGFHKSLVRILLVSALVAGAGCPLEDDAQVEDGGADGDESPEPDAIDEAMDAGAADAGEPVPTSEDAGVELDATVEVDAGEQTTDAGEDAGPITPEPIDLTAVPNLGGPELVDADRAKLIYDLIQAQGYVENWFPMLEPDGDPRPLIVTPGHGAQVRVRQNYIAKQAIDAWVAAGKASRLVMPTGSVIVKDSYKLEPDGVTYVFSGGLVMAKIAVLDATKYEGEWFYVRINAATNEPTYGATCVNCHNGRAAKALWPINASISMDPGGKADALVPYDYLFIAFCSDPKNELLCKAPE